MEAEITPAVKTWPTLHLQAVNVAGAGPFSEVVACMTPASVPAVVTCLRGLSEDEVESPHYYPSTCLAISWEKPCDHGSEITGYSIDFGDKQPITVGKVLSYFIDGLQPDTTYRYVVQSYLKACCFSHRSRLFVCLFLCSFSFSTLLLE